MHFPEVWNFRMKFDEFRAVTNFKRYAKYIFFIKIPVNLSVSMKYPALLVFFLHAQRQAGYNILHVFIFEN